MESVPIRSACNTRFSRLHRGDQRIFSARRHEHGQRCAAQPCAATVTVVHGNFRHT
jgi:hypothetical protein